MAMAGMERRTPTRRPAGEHWPGASTASLASALASASRRGMLRRGFAPSGQPAPSGNGASAVLIPQRAWRPEVLALLGSRSVPAAPVMSDAACRGTASCLPALPLPSYLVPDSARPAWWPGLPQPEQAREAEQPSSRWLFAANNRDRLLGTPPGWQLGQTPKEPPAGPQ